MTAVSAERVTAAAAAYRYARMGLRVLSELPDDGEVLEPSREWDDGEPTDRLLWGTSALDLKHGASAALALARAYPGCYVVLVGSDEWEHGEDEGEVILRDAIVLERWCRR